MNAREILNDKSFIEGEKLFNSEAQVDAVFLTEDMISRLLEAAAEKGAQVYREEHRLELKKQRSNKYSRTRKMLSGYRREKKRLADENNLTHEEEIEMRYEYISDLMNPMELAGKADMEIKDDIKRLRKDLFALERIEKAAQMYREECENSGSEERIRRYREMEKMYLSDDEYTVQEIAEAEGVSEKTVYRDMKIACEAMSAYLLGIWD